jgi:hypothetical protein
MAYVLLISFLLQSCSFDKQGFRPLETTTGGMDAYE